MYTPKWTALPTPEGSTFDKNGYVEPPKTNPDTSTWSGRAVKALEEGNEARAIKQRALGYKVYDQDPGKDPYEMNPYEQSQCTGPFVDNTCTIS